jgi:succinate-semialdehyde dehydrogenase/glutarate-semialdehyde dehydrogenase
MGVRVEMVNEAKGIATPIPTIARSETWRLTTIHLAMAVTTEQLAPRVSRDLLRRLEARIDVASDRERIPIIAPFTGETIGSIPQAADVDIEIALAKARKAQEGWKRLTPKTRARILTRFHDLLIDQAEIAIDLVQLEAGKVRTAAFEEVFDAIATTRYYANTGQKLLGRKRRSVSFPGLTTTYEYAHPHGVVGFIVPWNFPFTLGISDAVAALMAGNAAVIKPDEKTPYSTLFAVTLLEEAGLPPGLVQVITGDGDKVGPPLIDAVDFVMFTGSTAVGRVVAEQAARRLIGSSMELGGKNAIIVLADADLDTAIPGVVRAVFANGGQLCVAGERIYVEDSLCEEFTRRFVDAVENIELSTEFEYGGPVSSMITEDHLGNVQSHVEDAIERGATLLTGGKPRPDIGPWFFEPTVFTDVDESMTLCRTETFGPVVSIYPVPDAETAVALANDSDFGLNFSVWTADPRRGVEIASRLEAGTVGVNDGYAATWSSYDAPMGGMKQSGLSRRHGAMGLMKYTEPQTVSVQRVGPAFAPPGGMDYERYQAILGAILKVVRRLPFYK